MKFTREPAALVAAVQAALVLALSFGWLNGIGLDSQDDVATVVVVLNAGAGLYLAWRLSQTLLNPIIEFFKAALSLAAIYGFHITLEQTGMAISLIVALGALAQRQANDPEATPGFSGNVLVTVDR